MCVCDRMKNPFSIAGARLGRGERESPRGATSRRAGCLALAVRFYFSHEQRAFEIVMRTSPHAPLCKEREETEREDERLGGFRRAGRGGAEERQNRAG